MRYFIQKRDVHHRYIYTQMFDFETHCMFAGSSDLRLSQPPSVFQLPPLPPKSVSFF